MLKIVLETISPARPDRETEQRGCEKADGGEVLHNAGVGVDGHMIRDTCEKRHQNDCKRIG